MFHHKRMSERLLKALPQLRCSLVSGRRETREGGIFRSRFGQHRNPEFQETWHTFLHEFHHRDNSIAVFSRGLKSLVEQSSEFSQWFAVRSA
jgi:hypothetical protein